MEITTHYFYNANDRRIQAKLIQLRPTPTKKTEDGHGHWLEYTLGPLSPSQIKKIAKLGELACDPLNGQPRLEPENRLIRVDCTKRTVRFSS